jgi:two-component system, OmpR family, alkaline phosphatase synthesis response regulator PhoP
MVRALVIVTDSKTKAVLREGLARYDVACSFTSYTNGVREAIAGARPDVFLLELGKDAPDEEIWGLVRRARQGRNLPVIALVPAEILDGIDGRLGVDDFIVGPYDFRELHLRIERLLAKQEGDGGAEQIRSDGLLIDLATCEVIVSGAVVELTFKEYELLKLLAGNKGRVFTRQALLNSIWGYDYFGGDRTVDVHVRRLRSKIEGAGHTFIETVRNIGYRFVKDS